MSKSPLFYLIIFKHVWMFIIKYPYNKKRIKFSELQKEFASSTVNACCLDYKDIHVIFLRKNPA